MERLASTGIPSIKPGLNEAKRGTFRTENAAPRTKMSTTVPNNLTRNGFNPAPGPAHLRAPPVRNRSHTADLNEPIHPNALFHHANSCGLRYSFPNNFLNIDLARTPCFQNSAPVSRPNPRRSTMATTVNKHIRIAADTWQRLEVAARDRNTTANRLLTELATKWLEGREWPSTDVQIQVARASLFTAQAMARDMATAGRKEEISSIRRYISTIVSDSIPESLAAKQPRTTSSDLRNDDS